MSVSSLFPVLLSDYSPRLFLAYIISVLLTLLTLYGIYQSLGHVSLLVNNIGSQLTLLFYCQTVILFLNFTFWVSHLKFYYFNDIILHSISTTHFYNHRINQTIMLNYFRNLTLTAVFFRNGKSAAKSHCYCNYTF